MDNKVKMFQEKAKAARKLALDAVNSAGSGHLGGIMSIMDAMVVLYFDKMNIFPNDPRNPDRDRFVMSKGHCGPSLYTMLAMRGFFAQEELLTLNKNGTHFPSHCDMNKVPGVDMTAGSLAQGFSAAIGMALNGKLDHKDYRVYCVVGDGECQEGQIWEAALLGAQLKLDNITVLLDNNGGQVDGYTKDIEDVSPLDKKWEAFGWDVQVIDGHDHAAISDAIDNAAVRNGKPHAIVLNTVKAKGLVGLEGTPTCHHVAMNEKLYQQLSAGLS